MTKELTIAERLAAKKAEIDRNTIEISVLQLEPLKELLASVQGPAFDKAIETAERLLDCLDGVRQQWCANYLAVLRDHTAQMVQEVANIEALIAPPAPVQDPA